MSFTGEPDEPGFEIGSAGFSALFIRKT